MVVVGSIGDRIATPMLGAYNASKFGLLGLTDSLRAELAPSGLRVVLIEPGVISTGIWKSGRVRGEELLAAAPPEATRYYQSQIDRIRADADRAADHGLPPSAVAGVIAKAMTTRNPRPRYLVGRDARIAARSPGCLTASATGSPPPAASSSATMRRTVAPGTRRWSEVHRRAGHLARTSRPWMPSRTSPARRSTWSRCTSTRRSWTCCVTASPCGVASAGSTRGGT